MADAPERIWAMPARQLCWTEDNTNGIPVRGYYEYVRADITPPAAVVEAMERALRHADQVSRDLGWHRIYDETGPALTDLQAWRAGK